MRGPGGQGQREQKGQWLYNKADAPGYRGQIKKLVESPRQTERERGVDTEMGTSTDMNRERSKNGICLMERRGVARVCSYVPAVGTPAGSSLTHMGAWEHLHSRGLGARQPGYNP